MGKVVSRERLQVGGGQKGKKGGKGGGKVRRKKKGGGGGESEGGEARRCVVRVSLDEGLGSRGWGLRVGGWG
jgi:hypothetical protein